VFDRCFLPFLANPSLIAIFSQFLPSYAFKQFDRDGAFFLRTSDPTIRSLRYLGSLSLDSKDFWGLDHFALRCSVICSIRLHTHALPIVNWPILFRSFVEKLGLTVQDHRTQTSRWSIHQRR
jgi:hypothetical protein